MRFFRDLIFVVLFVAGLSLSLEACLRVAHERSNASLFQFDRERGYSLRPNAEGWYITAWGQEYIRINSDGMRDRERPVQRPANTLRVAVLGASDAMAPEVLPHHTFEAEMQRRLASELAPRGAQVDVLNFGGNGYAEAQQYLTLHSHVWKYDPKIVIQVWSENLFLLNTRETYPDAETIAAPLYLLRDRHLEPAEPTRAMKLALASSPWQVEVKNLSSEWMNRSYLLSLLNQGRLQLQKQIGALRSQLNRHPAEPAASVAARPSDYMERWSYQPYLPLVQDDWEIGEAMMRAMKEECDRHGAEYWIVIVDLQMQTHPNLAARDAFMRRIGVTSLTESDRRLERFCKENGIHVLTLAPPLADYAVAHNVFLRGVPRLDNEACVAAGFLCHWNEMGEQLAGRLIADDLRSRSSMVQAWAGVR